MHICSAMTTLNDTVFQFHDSSGQSVLTLKNLSQDDAESVVSALDLAAQSSPQTWQEGFDHGRSVGYREARAEVDSTCPCETTQEGLA